MTLFELIRPLIPKHGDKVCAGNVRFWNDQGEICYDKPTVKWDKEAVIRDITFNLTLLSIVGWLEGLNIEKPSDETVSSFAA